MLSRFFGKNPQVVKNQVVENPVVATPVVEVDTTGYIDISEDIKSLVNSKSFKSNIGHV